MIVTGKHRALIFLLRFLIPGFSIAFLMGCSGGMPGAAPQGDVDTPAVEAASCVDGQRMLWGYFGGYAHPGEGVFELTPMRAADTHLNLVSILNGTAGVSVQVLWGESIPAQGLYTVRVTLHHPYAYEPVYAGFDVRGILITGASQPIGPGLWTAGDGHPRLLNADGYTRWWNPVEFLNAGLFGYTPGVLGSPNTAAFDAQLNAYKIFADAFPSETDDDPIFLTLPALDDDTGRAVFGSQSNTRRYRIQFPPGPSQFNYAVDASWAFPAANPPEVPDDFPPAANCPEAWWVRCHENENTLKYYPSTGNHDGELRVSVYAYDWQGRMNGLIAPQISAVNVYSQDLFGMQVGQAALYYDDGIAAIYQADLTALCQPDSVGTYWLGIEVVSSGGKYKQSWQSAPSAALAAYQLMPIEVEEGSTGPAMTKKFGIHAWVLRKSDGTSPAISDADINEDIEYANALWNQYDFGFMLAERTYLDNSLYYDLDPYDAGDLFAWKHDITGLLNVYYVHSIVGMGGAFCAIACELDKCKAKSTYIVFDGPNNDGYEEVLTHELGHNIGMLEDVYMLDLGFTCYMLGYYHCGYYPTGVYCDATDCYYGNIMYWLADMPGTPPSAYSISIEDMDMNTPAIDSQGENAVHLHTHYPGNFKDMQ